MQQTPDLSKIVSLIMQNPSLISEIAALASSNEDSTASTESAESTLSTEPKSVAPTEREVQAVAEERTHIQSRTRRKELLSAMKPYLSEQRRGAIDSMSSILDILDVMMKKES